MKRLVIFMLIFNFTYAPMGPQAKAQVPPNQGNQPDFQQPEVNQVAVSAEEMQEIKKGSSVEVTVPVGEDGKAVGSAEVNIIPGTDMNAVYQEGRPSVIRARMGSLGHYLTLRNADPEYSPAAGEKQKDKRSPITLKDIRHGGIHFRNETLSFAIATFAICLKNSFLKYNHNPTAGSECIASQTDPIGTIGFYAFMVAAGYSGDFLTDKYLTKSAAGEALKAKYASRIGYLSMAAGSIASQFVGDALHTFTACSRFIFERNYGKGAVPVPQVTDPEHDPCEAAWKEWTLGNKFHTYGPSILSLWAGSKLAAAVDMGAKYGYQKLKEHAATKTNSKIARAFAKYTLEGTWLGEIAQGSGLLRWSFMILGKTPSFILFLAMTELAEPYTTKYYENLVYSVFSFPTLADELRFMLLGVTQRNEPWIGGRYDIIKWVSDFSETMEKWRELNQAEALKAHYAWLKKINNLKNVERFSFHYYNRFVEDMQKYVASQKAKSGQSSQSAQSKKKLSFDEELALQSRNTLQENTSDYQSVIYRKYPLMGVKATGTKDDDYNHFYLANPDKLEKAQLVTIRTGVGQLYQQMNSTYKTLLGDDDVIYLSNMIVKLYASLKLLQTNKENQYKIKKEKVSEELGKIANIFREIKSIIDNSQFSIPFYQKLTPYGFELLRNFFESLGSPSPSEDFGSGFARAFLNGSTAILVSPDSKLTAESYVKEAEVDYKFSRYRNKVKTDFLTYQMACGSDTNSNLIDESRFFADSFQPPRLVKSAANANICGSWLNLNFTSSAEMYSEKIKDSSSNSGKEYKGIVDFIINNFNDKISQIVNSDINKDGSRFALWWDNAVSQAVIQQFKKYETQYEEIAVDFVKNLFQKDFSISTEEKEYLHFLKTEEKEYLKINRGIVHNSIGYSTMQEIRIYSLLMGEILRKKFSGISLADTPALQIVKSGNLRNYRKSIMKDRADIFKFQVAPYNVDFRSISQGYDPQIFQFQYEIEGLIGYYFLTLSQIDIENSSGHEQVTLKIKDKDRENAKSYTEKTEKTVSAAIEKFKAAASSEEDQVLLEVLQMCKKKIFSLAGSSEGLINQITTVVYNRDAAVTKEKCHTNRKALTNSKSGDCKN